MSTGIAKILTKNNNCCHYKCPGNVLQRLSYDPWGTLRDPVTLVPFAPGDEPRLLLGRGYTGHEHLPWFGLVNMNARLYDPATGRFLNPDPLVQDPTSTQSFNRYSYCLNNPLRYSDPTGRDILHISYGGVIDSWEYTGNDNDDWFYTLPDVYCFPSLETFPGFRGNHEMHQMFRPPNNDVVIWNDGFNDFNYPDTNIPTGGAITGSSTTGRPLSGKTDNRPLDIRTLSIILATMSTNPTVVKYMWDYAVRDRLGMNPTQKVTAADYEKAFDKDMAKFSTGLKIIRKSLTIADFVITGWEAASDGFDGKPVRGLTRIAVWGTIFATSKIPYVGPFISVGLGIANAVWGDELIYDHIDN